MSIVENNVATAKADVALQTQARASQGTQGNTQAAFAQAAQQAQNNGQFSSADYGGMRFTFADQSSVFGHNMDIINDGLMKFEKSLGSLLDNRISTSAVDIKIVPLDHHNHRELALDVMLITACRKNTNIVGVYAIAISKTGEVLGTDQTADLNGRRYVIEIYPTQIFNERGIEDFFVAKAREKVAANNQKVTVVYGGGSVLYADETDFNDESVTLKVLMNGLLAALNITYQEESNQTGSVRDLNIGNHDKSEELICERKLLGGVVMDAHSRPLRADFQFVVNSNNTQGGSRFGSQSVVREVTSCTGFTDVLLVTPTGSAPSHSIWSRNRFSNSNDSNEATRMFVSNVVFTSLNPTKHQTINNMIWTLACGVAASWDNEWWIRQGLNPRNMPVDNPLSIAGLGYEINAVTRNGDFAPLPVDHPEFTDEAFYDLVSEYFTPNVLYSLEVMEGSADAWRYEPFLRAAFEQDADLNKPGSYNAKLLNHTNLLTAGLFEKHYRDLGGTGRVVSNLNGRLMVEGSYHNNQTNTRRSLQDFGRLMLLNLVKGSRDSMETSRMWTMAQVDEQLSTEHRVGVHTDIIRQVAPHAEITGYGPRIDFEAVYIEALQRAMIEAGVVLINNNVAAPVGQFHYANYIGSAMIDNLQGTMVRNGSIRAGNGSGVFNRTRY